MDLPDPHVAHVQVVKEFWHEFDLETRREELDKQGLAMAEAQERSQLARRQLADSTREFRRLPPEQKAKDVGALLKLYQGEVDDLTKRAKRAEAAFLELYQALHEAPDPVPALQAAVEDRNRLVRLDHQVRDLRQELAECEEELAGLRDQNVTIRRLEERVRELEADMGARVAEQVAVREVELEEEASRSRAEAEAEAAEAEARVQAAHREVEAARRRAEAAAAELLAARAQHDQEQDVRRSELELVSEEAQRAGQRAEAAEREREELQERLVALQAALQAGLQAGDDGQVEGAHIPGAAAAAAAATAAHGGEGARAWASVLEGKLREREAQLQFAEAEVRRWREAAEQAREAAARAAERDARQLDALRRRIDAAEAKLAQAPSAEEHCALRAEVDALRALEYGVAEDSPASGCAAASAPMTGAGAASPAAGAELGLDSPVDVVIARGLALDGVRQVAVRKLRRLETECSRLRATCEDLRAASAEVRPRR